MLFKTKLGAQLAGILMKNDGLKMFQQVFEEDCMPF